VLDPFFNLTRKSNLIGRLKYDLTQFVDNLVVAYFLGHAVQGGWVAQKVLIIWAQVRRPTTPSSSSAACIKVVYFLY